MRLSIEPPYIRLTHPRCEPISLVGQCGLQCATEHTRSILRQTKRTSTYASPFSMLWKISLVSRKVKYQHLLFLSLMPCSMLRVYVSPLFTILNSVVYSSSILRRWYKVFVVCRSHCYINIFLNTCMNIS